MEEKIITTVQEATMTVGGKVYPVTITRYKGLKTYVDETGREILCDQAIYMDAGPKLGGGWTYIEHKDYTPEEREAGRRRIIEVATQAMIDQGIW